MTKPRNNDMEWINVIDLESTCREEGAPKDQKSDIIEIGICELHVPTLSIGTSRSIAVWPTRSKVTAFCTQLTGWTEEALREKSVSLSQAFDTIVLDFNSRRRPWASWGAYDRNMIESVSLDHGLRIPVARQHINVKTLFALGLGLERECGMDEALRTLGWKLEGRHHSGVDDAKNISRILIELLKRIRREWAEAAY